MLLLLLALVYGTAAKWSRGPTHRCLKGAEIIESDCWSLYPVQRSRVGNWWKWETRSISGLRQHNHGAEKGLQGKADSRCPHQSSPARPCSLLSVGIPARSMSPLAVMRYDDDDACIEDQRPLPHPRRRLKFTFRRSDNTPNKPDCLIWHTKSNDGQPRCRESEPFEKGTDSLLVARLVHPSLLDRRAWEQSSIPLALCFANVECGKQNRLAEDRCRRCSVGSSYFQSSRGKSPFWRTYR